MPFGVLKHFHPMIGCDFHILMPPGSPAPGPPAPHLAMSSLSGLGIGGTQKFGPAEYSHFGWTMMRGTDIGIMIPHAGAPNCLLPIILLSSASKSNFGSSKHLIKNKPVAVALLILVNPNLNCGDPVPAPLDGVIAITAHFVGMTLGDFLAGLFEMALDIGLMWAIGKLGNKLDRISQRVYEKFLVGPLGSLLGRMGFGPISTWLLRHDFQEMMFKGFGAKLAKILGSDAIGSPLGYSFPINGFGVADSLFGENGAAQGSYDAVHDYVDSPSVDTHNVPPDGAEGSSGVDEGDGGTGGSSGDGGVPSDAGSDTAADSATSTSSDPNATPVDQAPNASTSDTPNQTSADSGGDSSTDTEASQTPADSQSSQTPADTQPNQTPADSGTNSSTNETPSDGDLVDRDPNDPGNSSSGR